MEKYFGFKWNLWGSAKCKLDSNVLPMQYLEQPILNCLLLCSQASKVIFALFWRDLVTDPSCSVLSKDEHALHFFTHHSLWFSTSVQSAEGGQPPPHTNRTCPSRLGMHHGPRTCFRKHRACVASRCVVPGCALYSCSEEECKTPNWVLKNSCPLEHLVLQLCSDSHQGHSFFSKLWVASPAAPWL